MVFISVFRAIFNCRSPQAGIIKLEWRVEAIFWKNPEERSEFTLPEPLNNYASKHGGPIVKLFLCRSVDGFSHLLRHFRQVLTSKISSEHRNLSVGVGGSTLLKNLWIKDGRTPCRRNDEITQNSYRPQTRQLLMHGTCSIYMAVGRPTAGER